MKLLKYSTLLVGLATLASCSAGSSGSGGNGGGTSNKLFSVPNLNCGSAPCISTNSRLGILALNSNKEIAYIGELVYNKFNTDALPELNTKLNQINTLMQSQGITTCEQVVALPDVVDDDISGDGSLFVTIQTQADVSPFGGATTKTFTLKSGSTAFAKVKMGCNGTQKDMYINLHQSPTERYEVWTSIDTTNANNKKIEAAYDSGTSKLTLHFVGPTATKFDLYGFGMQYPDPTPPHNPIDFAVSGSADLAADVVTIGYSGVANTPVPTVYSANNSNWAGQDIRHCYTPFSSWQTDTGTGAACTGASLTAPSTVNSKLRGNTVAVPVQADSFSTVIPVL